MYNVNQGKGRQMFGYVCFWKGKRCEVHALRSFDAQELARQQFQKGTRAKVKAYEVAVMLAEKNGETVTHSTTEV
jgi:hypothetical protein